MAVLAVLLWHRTVLEPVRNKCKTFRLRSVNACSVECRAGPLDLTEVEWIIRDRRGGMY